LKHIRAFVIKFLSTLALLFIILGVFNDMAFRNVFLISLVLAAAAYIIGDLFILPRTNNTVATIADFGLAFIIIWSMSRALTYGDGMLGEAFTAALALGIFEFLFHRYLAKNIFPDQHQTERRYQGTMQYQTEASEELTPVRPDVREEDNNDNL
jgi:hypothetical protein